MKNKSIKTKLLVFAAFIIGFVVLWQALLARCPESPKQLHINSTINIQYLYPWPGAKIPFACHIRDFLKSPFVPRLIDYYEVIYKENGFRILKSWRREGVVTARIFATGEFLPVFDESIAGKLPLLADNISFYIDGKKLNIGHISWHELDVQFHFATELNPFLLPGKHTGRVILALPSGETREYEWKFEITWW